MGIFPLRSQVIDKKAISCVGDAPHGLGLIRWPRWNRPPGTVASGMEQAIFIALTNTVNCRGEVDQMGGVETST